MNSSFLNKFALLLLFAGTGALFFSGCTDSCPPMKKTDVNEVVIHELSDPDMLNPINSSSANATYIEGQIFQTLLGTNPVTYGFYGFLAVDRPTISLLEEGEFAGGMKLEYEIRPEAKWDNGTPITAHDYIFTIKSILNPKTDCFPRKPYYDFVGDIVVDSANNKKFTIYSKNTYMLVEAFSGAWVIPEYVYDPEQIMRKFEIRQLNTPEKREALKGDTEVIRFADHFNSEKFQREAGYVVGSGAYEFKNWTTGQRIVLERKKDWWGNALVERGVEGYAAYPDKLEYEIINDITTAVTSMKGEGVDLMRGIEPKKFTELLDDKCFNSKYKIGTPTMFSYYYLGLNTRSPKLSDPRVRKALAHAVNKEKIIDAIMYNRAQPTVSMVHPKKVHYDKTIQPYKFDLELAQQLLDEAGWKDTDGDGVRDKVIDGEKVDLKLTYKYNTGNEVRESIGLMFKEDAKSIGVDISIIPKEWTVYLDELDNHEFEISCAAWVGSATMGDPKQIWHTESAVIGGSNYVGFGNAESDALIDSLRYEIDEQKRIALFKEFQKMVHEASPYIFLFTPTERIAVHKRFDAPLYAVRPGYNEGEFKLVPVNTESDIATKE